MEENIKELIQRQEEMAVRLEKLERHIKIAKMFTLAKIILILVPVVLAVIYLPPFLEEFLSKYFQILEELNLR